ncbi:MAG: glycosyltransferase family 4 protein [Planctomycetaceae bacterium]|jgi:N,N'-diacetylbacillosaminyl-diphospho-undecaprenol alpha-1,3-N-acetylgalactosaminyltransferase|nr:glycosyltransferase family 4 protein [Planctomycetaceae bacterium]
MKIVVISSTDHAVWQFRSEFIATLIYNKHDVIVISPDGPFAERIRCLGARHIEVPVSRFIGPLSDLFYLLRLYRLLHILKPDFVYTMTTKPNIFCPGIAKLTRVPQVCSVFGGLGFIYSEGGGLLARTIKKVARIMLKFGTKFTDHFVFQNKEDRDIFIHEGILKNKHYIVVNGSGVNLREFSMESVNIQHVAEIRKELGISETGIFVLMISRISRNKGILEFIEASQFFSDMKGSIKFIHAGSFENGSLEEISQNQIKETLLFKQIGYRTDIRELIYAADIIALPSYHREGIPNVLLEAMAMKKPIITTDNVGCRDVVNDGVNGILVPVRNPEALALAIRHLANDPVTRSTFGEAGFEKVKQYFTVESVNKTILSKIFQLKDINIPEFFTEDTDEQLLITLNGKKQYFTVSPISKNCVLNGGQQQKNNKKSIFNFRSIEKGISQPEELRKVG